MIDPKKSTRARRQPRTAEERLAIVSMANIKKNITEICDAHGISRSMFYRWKDRYERGGIEALRDTPKVRQCRHPHTTPQEIITRIVDLALTCPSFGCGQISEQLRLDGYNLSPVTVQKILNRRALGKERARWIALEDRARHAIFSLSDVQIRFLEKYNPCIRERHIPCTAPGERLQYGTIPLGFIPGTGRIYAHALVDCFSGHAFVAVHPSRRVDFGQEFIIQSVEPFYRRIGVSLGMIEADQNTVNAMKKIVQSNKHRAELAYFFRPAEKEAQAFIGRLRADIKAYWAHVPAAETTIAALNTLLENWITVYNAERPWIGYPNYGVPPLMVVKQWLCECKGADELAGSLDERK